MQFVEAGFDFYLDSLKHEAPYIVIGTTSLEGKRLAAWRCASGFGDIKKYFGCSPSLREKVHAMATTRPSELYCFTVTKLFNLFLNVSLLVLWM